MSAPSAIVEAKKLIRGFVHVERSVQVLLGLPARPAVVRVTEPDVGRRDAVAEHVVPVVVIGKDDGALLGDLDRVVVGLEGEAMASRRMSRPFRGKMVCEGAEQS